MIRSPPGRPIVIYPDPELVEGSFETEKQMEIVFGVILGVLIGLVFAWAIYMATRPSQAEITRRVFQEDHALGMALALTFEEVGTDTNLGQAISACSQRVYHRLESTYIVESGMLQEILGRLKMLNNVAVPYWHHPESMIHEGEFLLRGLTKRTSDLNSAQDNGAEVTYASHGSSAGFEIRPPY